MPDYVDAEKARNLPGLRLVLTAGVPGPWGEAAKALFHVKKIAYTPVRQDAGQPNEALKAWTGETNAPQAVIDDEPARTGWAEILLLAERLESTPRLIPTDPAERAFCFGLLHEIAGEDGFAWNRRLQLLHPMMSSPDAATNPAFEGARRLAKRYRYSAEAVERAEGRVCDVLSLFSRQLAAQKAAGNDYLLGPELSAVDLYWATFAAMIEPLPPEQCPMPEMLRGAYGTMSPKAAKTLDRALLAHRDFVYERHLPMPLDF
jgi:glutathione S-transferase